MECSHCGYVWEPRVPDPKSCPMCKRPLQNVSSRKIVHVEEQVTQTRAKLIRCNKCDRLAMYVTPLLDNPKNSYCLEHHIEWHRTQRQITEEEVLSPLPDVVT